MGKILLVDDDANTLASLARAFRLANHEAVVADSADRALGLLKDDTFDIVFSDVVMPGKDGLALLADIRKTGNELPVVMISGQATIDMAVRATRMGAFDFLEKPVSTDKLLLTTENALKLVRLESENRKLRLRVGGQDIIWRSPVMEKTMSQIERVAPTEARVCILGETGTGKEVTARAIHGRSRRRNGPFVTLNCAAVPAELIESELFGHEKGSFTGATMKHAGKFEQANGGTLFLDEIGDMPQPMQTKLLRVLEMNEVERIGGDKPVSVDVRVVVATHRNLESMVAEGSFRQDLFHRIYVYPLRLPALRERPDDIAVLADYFASQVTRANEWKPRSITPEAYDELKRYDWPGNVRELRNVIERALLFADADVTGEVVRQALGTADRRDSANSYGSGPLATRVESFERGAILSELKARDYRMTETAKALGLERSHLYKKCQQLGIDIRAIRGQEA